MTDGPPASDPFPMAPTSTIVGQILDGRYRILKLIGEGGMGEVYAAEHVHIEKKFAIKLLKSEIVSNQEAVTRFRQEARSSSSIGHRNIIAIDDFGQLADGRIYMCMELLNGAALNDMIQRPMSADRLLNILIQTGHGLAAAHAKGIVHRDMKPENIFVTIGPAGEDIPKILDFGIAKVSGNDGQNHLTRTGTIFGTPFYMAPEQALGNPVDARTDIYAMGVIMYECFAGSLPFQGESFMGILTQHITSEPEPVAQRAAKAGRVLPNGLADVIMRCMRKNPVERYGAMDELVTDLVAIYRGIAGPGMSTYMEAFPAGAAQHMAQPTPPPMTPNHPSAPNIAAVGGSGPVPYYDPHQGAPMSGGQTPYPQPMPGAVKKSNTGLIIAVFAVLAVGGGIAAFVVLGGSKPSNSGGTGSGSAQVAGVDPGSGAANSSGSDTHIVTPPPLNGSNTTVPAAGSNDPKLFAGSNGGGGSNAGAGSNAGPGSATVPGPVTHSVMIAGVNGAEILENGVRVGEIPKEVSITEGVPRTFVIKARGYRDKTLVVDGKRDEEMAKMDRIATATPTPIPHNTTTVTPPPPKMDCSQKLVDAHDKNCQVQYCTHHPKEPACNVMD